MPIPNIRATQLCVIFHTSEFFLSSIQFFFKKITLTIIWSDHMNGKSNQQKHNNGYPSDSEGANLHISFYIGNFLMKIGMKLFFYLITK